MSYRDDGRLMCKHGHEQADFREEEAEGIIEGSTRRHTKRIKRMGKREVAQNRRRYGRNAHFFVLQGYQEILKLQVTMLVSNEGAPADLVGAAQNLWLLYVSQLANIESMAVEDKEDEDGEAEAATGTAVSHIGARTSSQSILSQGAGMIDNSLDFLLQKVDEDIAQDTVEMLEWEQRNQQQQQHEGEPGAEPKSAADTGAQEEPAARPERTAYGSSKVVSAGAFPRLEYLPALIILAFAWLRIPVSFGDMYQLLADERIPFVSAKRYVSDSVTSRLGDCLAMSMFSRSYVPGTVHMQRTVHALEQIFRQRLAVLFPLPDPPVVLLSLLKRLQLSITLYPMAIKIFTSAGRVQCSTESQQRAMHLPMAAALVICLKLHYGLDEIERVTLPKDPPTEKGLDLPPLGEFLDKWRQDWEAELSIGTMPFLTALGEDWEQRFAAYYKRLARNPNMKHHLRVFRMLGPKYAQLAKRYTAASSAGQEPTQHLDPQTPSSMAHGSDTAQAIDPLRLSTPNASPPKKACPKRPLGSIAGPFDNHPGVSLQRGEQYPLFIPRPRAFHGPGYMMPTMGLILARCATVLGCSVEKLLICVSNMEIALYKQVCGAAPI
ncbi:hypothetical protein GGF46_002677 [Coemansia sp. RSA 552]|nr:hypothetical protein GGF46_002677 [Coemansia sp. RSA 552]